MRAYAQQGLDRNIEVQDEQNKGHLNSMTAGANMASSAISKEEASWQDGGYRVKEKGLQDDYSLGMHNLGMSEFDRQIKASSPLNLKDGRWLDYVAGGFSGASMGMGLGDGIHNFKENWGTPFSKLFEKRQTQRMQRKVDEGQFSFKINARPVFETGSSAGNLRIENPNFNIYPMNVEIYLDDSQELIYNSGGILPNHHVASDTLNTNLPAGEYHATAYMNAYHPDTMEFMGKTGVKMILSVVN
jgi:hypothetical protein